MPMDCEKLTQHQKTIMFMESTSKTYPVKAVRAAPRFILNAQVLSKRLTMISQSHIARRPLFPHLGE